MKLEELTVQTCSINPTHHEMNVLDEHTTHALDAARKYMEGMKRNVPFTTMKQKKESTMKYVKALKSKAKGKNVDEKLMLRRQELLGIDHNNMSKEELEALLKKAAIEWKETLKLRKGEEKRLCDQFSKGNFDKTHSTCYRNMWEKVPKRS